MSLMPTFKIFVGQDGITSEFRVSKKTKEGYWILLINGRETFYNSKGELLTWHLEEHAITWFESIDWQGQVRSGQRIDTGEMRPGDDGRA